MVTNQFKYVYQFKIVLTATKPPVWRRMQVPDNYSFKDLHVAIQNVMNWEVYAGSSYEFNVINPATGLQQAIGCSCYGLSQFMGINEPLIRIIDYFNPRNTKANYMAKHETMWNFKIEFEKILPADEFEIYPICINGKRASPPEDCGGADKYQDMLEAINESNSEKDRKTLKLYQDVFDEDFDPERFDPDNVFFTSGSGNPPLPNDFLDRLI